MRNNYNHTLGFNKSIYLELRWIAELMFLILISPIWLSILFIAILLLYFDSFQNPIFIQKRLGKNCKPFNIIKLRTIKKVDNDFIISKIANFYRKHRIDEIPQFFNIIKKDMSLIGPRPDPFEYYSNILNFIPDYLDRHQVMPGITGLAQITSGYASTNEEYLRKFELDMEYIENISLRYDLNIIFSTFNVILKSINAK